MYLGRLLIAVSFCAFTLPALAHDFVHAHSCIKPNYEIDYEDEEQLAQLDKDFSSYQECLREFARYQLDQVMAHTDVSSAAMDDLRAIADDVLKYAPEEIIEEWRAESVASEPE